MVQNLNFDLSPLMNSLGLSPELESFSSRTPGFCYLLFFVESSHDVIGTRFGTVPRAVHLKSIALLHPEILSDRKLMITLNAACLKTSYNLTAHVTESNQAGKLKPMALLQAIPDSCYIGIDVLDIDKVTVSKLPVKRMMWEAQVLTTNAGSGAVYHLSLTTGQKPFMEVASPWPVVTLLSFKAHLHPLVASSSYFSTFYYAWHANTDNAPNSPDSCFNYPNSGIFTLASEIPRGYWSSFSLECPLGKDGLSSVVKAPGSLGLYPVLSVILLSKPMPGIEPKPHLELAKIFFEVQLQIGLN